MKRIAAPMVGGMVSTVLTLVVIPAIYSFWKEHLSIRTATSMALRQPSQEDMTHVRTP